MEVVAEHYYTQLLASFNDRKRISVQGSLASALRAPCAGSASGKSGPCDERRLDHLLS